MTRATRDDARERTRAVPRRRRWILPLLMAAVTAAVLAVYYTPVLGVRTVTVTGTATLQQRDVLAAAGIPIGQPMLQVDAGAARQRLEAVPKVASAAVRLEWPSTVHIEVTERAPVAFVVAGDEFQLVDSSGVVFSTVPQAPPGFPELRAWPGDPAGHAAVTVLAGLPPMLSGQVASAVAPTPNDIRLMLKDGREVDWGDSSESVRKAAILPPLLSQPGKVFDVRSPGLATIAG